MIRRVTILLTVLDLYAVAQVSAQEKAAKILIIGTDNRGGNAHVWMHTCAVPAKAVRCTPNVETVGSNDWPKDAKIAERVRAIAVYCPRDR